MSVPMNMKPLPGECLLFLSSAQRLGAGWNSQIDTMLWSMKKCSLNFFFFNRLTNLVVEENAATKFCCEAPETVFVDEVISSDFLAACGWVDDDRIFIYGGIYPVNRDRFLKRQKKKKHTHIKKKKKRHKLQTQSLKKEPGFRVFLLMLMLENLDFFFE